MQESVRLPPVYRPQSLKALFFFFLFFFTSTKNWLVYAPIWGPDDVIVGVEPRVHSTELPGVTTGSDVFWSDIASDRRRDEPWHHPKATILS